MSQQPDESQGQQQNDGNSNGHPAWQEILETLPDDLHPLVKPKLEEWDRNVQQKLQEVRAPYDPYKPLVENNIPVDMVEQALYLHHQLENNPQELIAKAIEHYKLDYVPKDQIQVPDPEDLEDEFDGIDITKHPAFQQLSQQLEQFNSKLTEKERLEQEAAEQEELDNYLDQLEQEKGPFNKLMVATLIANGMDGEQAVETYKSEIAQAVQQALGQNQQQQNQPPVVMGGDGTSGSGVPEQPVKMGDLSKDDLMKLSMQFLEQNNQQT